MCEYNYIYEANALNDAHTIDKFKHPQKYIFPPL